MHHLPINVAEIAAGTVLATACFGMLSVSLGALTRNTMASIIGGLVWVGVIGLAIVEPSLPAVGKWLPSPASKALTNPGQGGHGLLSPAVAALVLIAWGAALSLVASRVTIRREVR